MSAALTALAVQAGFPILQKILSGRLGDANGQLAADIIAAIAGRVGIAPEQLDQVQADQPGKVIDAMREVERSVAPEKIDLYAKEIEARMQMMEADAVEPLWARAWRPGWMYLLGIFWLWNIALLHIANAIWRIALPPVPFDQLLGLTSVFMGLYMGGHTVKDVISKWVTK